MYRSLKEKRLKIHAEIRGNLDKEYAAAGHHDVC
jgi:hypothetical protein